MESNIMQRSTNLLENENYKNHALFLNFARIFYCNMQNRKNSMLVSILQYIDEKM